MSKLYTLKNDNITIVINSMGAELVEIFDNKEKVNYLWSGDSKYWGRVSPILFPTVGGCKNKEQIIEGRAYPITQHGFARDNEFELAEEKENEIWFSLKSVDSFKTIYPYDFELRLGYELKERTVIVKWNVVNISDKTIYFGIGGHPAFMCPFNGQGVQTDYQIKFGTKEPMDISVVDMNTGLLSGRTYKLETNQGYIKASNSLFDEDALVIENNQCHSVALVNQDGKEYVKVQFDAPLFGVWSVYKSDAPFICIEPWYGRCDRNTFEGDIKEREWINKLEIGEEFNKCYTITV